MFALHMHDPLQADFKRRMALPDPDDPPPDPDEPDPNGGGNGGIDGQG